MRIRHTVSKLAHKIIFLENKANNAIDEEEWEEVLALFAEISPLCDTRFVALENIAFGNIMAEKYSLFRTRYTDQINSNMRIKFKNRIFEIKRIVNEKERGKFLSIVGLEI